tara:strand:+ start:129 stop:296 length:168 start_codon:yes stop_codon:yes gene_type:complete
MKLIKFAIKNAFITGALTAGAFITGATIGLFVNKEKIVNKLKKSQFKKNKSASIE